jgi:hypothetical protein
MGGRPSGKTRQVVDSLFDYVRANPNARVCLCCRDKLSPFMAAAVGYVRMNYPDVTVTILKGHGKKDGVKDVAYQYFTDWPKDSP